MGLPRKKPHKHKKRCLLWSTYLRTKYCSKNQIKNMKTKVKITKSRQCDVGIIFLVHLFSHIVNYPKRCKCLHHCKFTFIIIISFHGCSYYPTNAYKYKIIYRYIFFISKKKINTSTCKKHKSISIPWNTRTPFVFQTFQVHVFAQIFPKPPKRERRTK